MSQRRLSQRSRLFSAPVGLQAQVLPPVNFTLTVSALAQVLLRWEPNPDQEQKNYTIRYEVKILSPVPEEYDTAQPRSVRTAALHGGFSARVRTLLLHGELQHSSAWVEEQLPPLPGAPGTSITNLSCVTHITIAGTVSLHCTWLPGQGAPEDTQYFLFYRYKNYTEECHNYVKDKWHRNTECSFPGTHIDPEEVDDDIVIHINGSSKGAAIKPFQQLFKQNAIEKVNIPRNITVSLEQNDLLASWEKPISPFNEKCFEYEFSLVNLRSRNKQILRLSQSPFRLRIDTTSRYSVQLRANHHPWCGRGVWSDWSEVIYVGCSTEQPLDTNPALNPPLFAQAEFPLECDPVGTQSYPGVECECVLVTEGNHVWTKLFPPIPTPSNKFRDLFPVDYERARTCTSDTETEFSSFAEDVSCRALDDSVF
ncbi:interleukin 5 receptor subunit alpha [Willisornis vidua]|uniref:Interleukin 5 receptor subunit alpha n=1 Tax=Willisornis vidua TaxID=1566151 RepID=A0ABQ9D4X7_9PASS|nr:interleukin 5 receptor subunit alpha [Willisornis vidua]